MDMRNLIQIVEAASTVYDALYHGTSSSRSRAYFANGFYLTNSLSHAKNYASTAAEVSGGQPVVLKISVKLNNPIIVSEDEIEWLGYEPDCIARYIAAGHDAAMRGDGVEIFVFSPSSIRHETILPFDNLL